MNIKRKEFEKLYNSKTSFWHTPREWFKHAFHPDKGEIWQKEMPPSGWPVEKEVGDLYTALVQMLCPRTILETGTNVGYSTYCLAEGLASLESDGLIYTIDRLDGPHLFADTDVEEHVCFVQGDSTEVPLDRFVREGETSPSFDMIVTDSDHHYRTVIAEVNRFAQYLKKGGVLIIHDSMSNDGVGLVIKQMQESGVFELVNLPTPRLSGKRPTGVTIARKIKECSEGFLEVDSSKLEVNVNLPGRTHCDPPLVW